MPEKMADLDAKGLEDWLLEMLAKITNDTSWFDKPRTRKALIRWFTKTHSVTVNADHT